MEEFTPNSKVIQTVRRFAALAPPDRSAYPGTLAGYKEYVASYFFYRECSNDMKEGFKSARSAADAKGSAQPKGTKPEISPEAIAAKRGRRKAKKRRQADRRRLAGAQSASKLASTVLKTVVANENILKHTTRVVAKAVPGTVEKRVQATDKHGQPVTGTVLKMVPGIVDIATPVDFSAGWTLVGPRGRLLNSRFRKAVADAYYSTRISSLNNELGKDKPKQMTTYAAAVQASRVTDPRLRKG